MIMYERMYKDVSKIFIENIMVEYNYTHSFYSLSYFIFIPVG